MITAKDVSTSAFELLSVEQGKELMEALAGLTANLNGLSHAEQGRALEVQEKMQDTFQELADVMNNYTKELREIYIEAKEAE